MGKKFKDTAAETCGYCSRVFEQTQLGGISDAILQRKPTCGRPSCIKKMQKEFKVRS